ncbi:hypothetical protein JTB14_020970 [Gonioctena quinquepunctata]|nr:hypothetical protein JTB14_020970 [Gonioctena quinquepunctata]
MLFDVELPDMYWGEAINTANYLQNRLPSGAIDSTPYEIWEGEKQKLDHLRSFGYTAHIYIPKEKRSKLNGRANGGIFVGYSENHGCYRVLRLSTNRITISRTVKFIENQHSTSYRTKQIEITGGENEEDNVEAIMKIPEVVETEKEENTRHCEFEIGDSFLLNGIQTVGKSEKKNKGIPAEKFSYISTSRYPEEPKSWSHLMQFSEIEKQKWMEVMDDELESFRQKKVWSLTDLPENKKSIDSKWVYIIIKYKARLVAKGFTQKYGEDYDGVFSPVLYTSM